MCVCVCVCVFVSLHFLVWSFVATTFMCRAVCVSVAYLETDSFLLINRVVYMLKATGSFCWFCSPLTIVKCLQVQDVISVISMFMYMHVHTTALDCKEMCSSTKALIETLLTSTKDRSKSFSYTILCLHIRFQGVPHSNFQAQTSYVFLSSVSIQCLRSWNISNG